MQIFSKSITFLYFIYADECDISEFIYVEVSELDIYYDLREIRYKDDHFFDYEAKEEPVRIEALSNN